MDTIKKRKILLRLYYKDTSMKRYSFSGNSTKIKEIISHEDFLKSYLKVTYGKTVCTFGCVCEFYNDGWYSTKTTLIKALTDFRKEDL